jgi:hypothetical protein
VLVVQQLQLRLLQVRPLHLWQPERALLHQRQPAHRHPLRQLRPGVHDQYPRAEQLTVRDVRQGGRPLLLGQHLCRRRHAVHLRQQLGQLCLPVQAMRGHRPILLLELGTGRLVSRPRHRVQQLIELRHVHSVRWRGSALLCQQDVYRGRHRLQQLEPVRGLRHAWHLDLDGFTLLRRQPVQ